METLSEKLHIKYGKVEGAYLIKNTKGSDALEALRTICENFDIDLRDDKYVDSDIGHAAGILRMFCEGCSDETGYVISVWFNNEE